MKTKILSLVSLVLISLSAFCQDVDSTKILQPLDQVEQKYILHFLSVMDKNDPEVFSLTLEFMPQYDSVGKELSNKLISFPKGITSGLMANGMRKLSWLREGEAAQFNDDMLIRIYPKLTNPWLIRQFNEIRDANFKARDNRLKAEADKIEQMIKLRQ